MVEGDPLALSRRRKIFEHISEHPGTYLREMERTLELSVGDLQYHLQQLEKSELISPHDDGKRKGYFVNQDVQFIDRAMLSVLKLKTPRRIVTFLLLNPDSSFKEILAEFTFTKGALSFHLKRLTKAGMLEKSKLENNNIYSIVDEERVSQMLITYSSGIMDEALDSFIDVWTKI